MAAETVEDSLKKDLGFTTKTKEDMKYKQQRHKIASGTDHTGTHPDLTELHLDLFGDHIGPVLFSQEVPEYPSQKSIDPSLWLLSLF